MSKAVLARLARFDVPEARPDYSALVVRPAPRPAVPLPETAPPTPAPAPEPPAPAPTGLVIDPAALDATLAGLADAIERVERDARAEVNTAVSSLAASLFPKLAELFLAEEIGRHLPDLVPSTAVAVEIRAAPPLAEELGDVIARHPGLQARCKLVTCEDTPDQPVEVSWTSGGASFDFSGLLEACLARLDSTLSDKGP